MSKLLKDIKLKKNPQEFWSKYFSSIFAPYISVALIKFKIDPNIITLLMLPSSFLCIYFSIFIINKELKRENIKCHVIDGRITSKAKRQKILNDTTNDKINKYNFTY